MQSVRVLLSLASFLLRDTSHWDTVYIGLLGFAIFSTAFLARPPSVACWVSGSC